MSASPLRCIDDSAVAVAESFHAAMNGDDVQQVWSGPFVMIDAESDASLIVAHCNRYSKPAMGRRRTL